MSWKINAFDLGKMFSYGLLYCPREHKDFVKDVFSTDIDSVAEKQGIEKALVTMLSDDLNQKYVDCARMDPAAFKVKHKKYAQYIWTLVAVG